MTTLYSIAPVINDEFVTEQCLANFYPIDKIVTDAVAEKLMPGITVVLFSGGFRLDLNATYIEPKMFSKADLRWKPDTIFVDTGNQTILEYTLSKIKPTNILILNSAVFLQYRLWTNIQHDIVKLKKFASQVIVSVPVNRFDFNRLKYSYEDIAKQLNGKIINNTLIICQ